jgi:hypothetical protein
MKTSDDIYELDVEKALKSIINYDTLYEEEKQVSDSYHLILTNLKKKMKS